MNFCMSVLERLQLCPIFSVNYGERRVPPKAFALCMIFVETDSDWYFSTSCDLFIAMKTRFSQSGLSLHMIASAALEAYLECLRHTSSFSSSIVCLSHLWVSLIKLLFLLVKLKFYFFLSRRFDQHAVVAQFTPSGTMAPVWPCFLLIVGSKAVPNVQQMLMFSSPTSCCLWLDAEREPS